MRLLALLVLLPVCAYAQQQTVRGCPDETAIGKSSLSWANCTGETWELPHPNLIVSVRATEATNPTWQRASEANPEHFVVVCDKLPVGSTIDCTPNVRVKVGSLNWGQQPEPDPPEPPTVPPGAGPLVVSWKQVTHFTDDSPIPNLAAVSYRVETSALPAGPWNAAWNGSALSASIPRPSVTACTRVSAVYESVWSLPSDVTCVGAETLPPSVPPNAPVIVGDTPKALALVSGSATSTRAVYTKSASGSRGTKLGDLNVGPATIVDYARVRCDVGDVFTYGTTRYGRVTDARAPEALRAGYVAGCVLVGTH